MLEDTNFSKEDFARSNWQKIISPPDIKTISDISSAFSSAAKLASENGDRQLYKIYLLLHAVSKLWLRPEEIDQPFAAEYKGANGLRSIDIIDFSDSHINQLIEIFNDIENPELRARIGDVIWTYKHSGNYAFAEAAVDAYLKASEDLLLTDVYYYGTDRIIRAIHLGASLGKNSNKFKEAVLKIEELIVRHSPAFPPFIGRLLDLLFVYREGDAPKYALLSQDFAEHHQRQGEWHLARAHWNAAARWHRLCDHADAEKDCHLKEVDCYVNESEDTLKRPSGMQHAIAARHLQSAIELLRKIPGTEICQKELHRQMLALQLESRNEMGKISQKVDLTPIVEKAILCVQGKSFQEGLFSLCMMASSPKVKKIQEMVKEMASDTPLLFWIPFDVVNDKGRTIGRRDSLFTGTARDISTANLAEMHRWASYEQHMWAEVINAARLQLLQEHTPEFKDFLDLVSNNPFVPLDREIIFSRGFLAGMQGDFLVSIHLLLPQVENSLRFLLNRQGIITSSLNSEGIQEEFDLNVLLGMSELNQIFDEDLIFDLQCNLTSRFGSNYRNLMAHGLLDQQDFLSNSAVYIWWLLLRICCLLHIIAQNEGGNEDATIENE
jgi:hypothetical protein